VFSGFLAISTALSALLWFGPLHLRGAPLTGTDFSQYCEAVIAAVEGRAAANPHRSALVASALAPLAARAHALDALFLGAVASTALLAAGAGAWALAVSGRVAAVAAMLACLSVAPIALLPRTVSFYPEMAAAFMVASAAAAWACARGGLLACVLGAALVGLAPLVDLRGVIWFVPCAVLVGAGAVLGPEGEGWRSLGGWARRLVAVALVALVLLGAWRLGPRVWPANLGGTLEMQAYSQVQDVARRAGARVPFLRDVDAACRGRGFAWGHGGAAEFPRVGACLAAVNAVASNLPRVEESRLAWSRQGAPWVPVLATGFALGALRHWRRPRRALALLGAAVPSVAMLASAENEPDLRRLGQALLAVPVALGVGVEAVLAAPSAIISRRLPQFPRAPAFVEVAGVVLFALLVGGVVPSPLSPVARWRAPFTAQSEYLQYDGPRVMGREAYDRVCATALAGRAEAGWAGAIPTRPWP